MKSLRCAVALFAIVVLASTAFAAGFTLEQVMSSPFPTDLTASARGGRIAWTFAAKGVRNVWIADAPSFAARQVTHYTEDDGMPIASVRLTPDGKTVLYARGSETNGAGEVAGPTSNVEQPKQQVWALDVDGGAPRMLGEMACGNEGCEDIEVSPDGQNAVWSARRKLWIAPISGSSPAKELAYIRGDARQPKWSPDSRQILFVSQRGDHSFIGVVTLGSKAVQWIAPSVDIDGYARWSPDGRQVAFVRVNGRMQRQPMMPIVPEPWSIWIGDVSTGKGHAIWHSAGDLRSSIPRQTLNEAFHFGKGYILFSYETHGWAHLYSVPVSGGKEILLTPGRADEPGPVSSSTENQGTDFDIEHVTLSRDGASAIFSSNQDDIDRRHIWRVALAGGKPVALSSGQGSEYEPEETGDGKFVVCFGSSGTSPKMPYVLGSSGRKMIAAEALPKDFPSAELVEPKQVIFKAKDGWTIHGQLFVPKGRTAAGPALLFMHGGSRRQMLLGFHYMYYYHNSYAENQYLASLGYVVLSVNYRTGIMYGRDFREVADGGRRGGSEYKDIVAAAKYLQTLPTVDSHKIGLWGGSYGGYLTAMGLARNSDIFSAGVDMHGVHDWSTRLGGGGRGAGAGDQAPDQREAHKAGPIPSSNASISTWKSPVLLIQGDDDRNVDFSQMVDLVQRLRAQHVPFEQIVFPDEIHDFLLWHSWYRAYEAEADFFDRTLKRGDKIGTDN